MPRRSRLIASTRSSRSVTSVPCWVSTSRSSSSARRLTAPSRSRSRLSLSRSLRPPRCRAAACPPRSRRAPRVSPARSPGSRGFRRRGRRAGASPPRAAPLRAPRLRVPPRGRHGRRVRRGRPRRARSHPRQRSAAVRRALSAALDLGDQRTALRLELGRRIDERSMLGPGLVEARLDGRDLRRGAFPPLGPGRGLGGDRGKAALGNLDLAGERLGFGAHLGEPNAVGGDGRRGYRRAAASDAAEGARSSSASAAAARASCVSASVVVTRACASASAERREVMRLSSRSAAAWRSRAASASRWAARQRLRAAFSASRVAATSRFGRGHRVPRARRDRRATMRSSASMSARRLRPASRRAAAVGAWAATAKPSQRHRSPSCDTSRWPGLSLAQCAAPSARGDDADLGEPPRHGVRRRGDEGGQSGMTPAGSGGSATSTVAPPQWIGAAASTGASRSSPSAAPSAVS